jgi:cyclopropane-fatty-acyl-phospholipid synthase
MAEHVGERWYTTYVGILDRALKPGGRLVVQQMSRHPDAAPGDGAFIEAYTAPDMRMRPLWQTVRDLQDAVRDPVGCGDA